MTQRLCPECRYYAVVFDPHFQRPRCYNCGWLPERINVCQSQLFELCYHCWGYEELMCLEGYCKKCVNRGKVPTLLGKETMDIANEILEEPQHTRGDDGPGWLDKIVGIGGSLLIFMCVILAMILIGC